MTDTSTEIDALRECHDLLAEDVDALGPYAPADAEWQLQALASPDDVTNLAAELAAVHGRRVCFLDPRHGPGPMTLRVHEHRVPVCALDAEHARPRMVRLADRWVPWYAAGPTYDAYAAGYFGTAHEDLRLAAFQLTLLDLRRARR